MAPLKSLLLGASLATLALSTPLATDAENLYARQFGTGSTANELEQGSCKDVTLIFARGSTELGNMVCLFPSFTRVLYYPRTYQAQHHEICGARANQWW